MSQAAGHGRLWLLLPVFFVSGAAGLIYEVVWARQLSLIFGVTTYAVATVLAVFMGGLAAGSYALGRWSDRWGAPLRAYALLEAGVGLYALVVPTLLEILRPAYIALHQLGLPPSGLASGRVLLAGATLLLPTALMGGTYPILVRLFARAPGEIGRAAGILYFVNTAGAVTGCLIAGFLLIEHRGLIGTTRIAAALSLFAAIAALGLGRLCLPRAEPPARAHAAPPAAAEPSPAAARLALLCIGLSGFAALAYEVLWTRALLRYLYNSTYAFTVTLATFLTGLALGGLVYGRWLRARPRPLLVFAGLELLIALGFVASTLLFEHMLPMSDAILGADAVRSFRHSLASMFLRAALILFLPTLFLGATLPLATEICARQLASLGRGVGRVYAVNTLGAIFGSLGAAFLLIPALGMRGSLDLLIGLNLAMAAALLLAAKLPARDLARFGLAGAAASALALLALPGDVFRRSFAVGQQLLYYHEGATDTVGVAELHGQRAILYDDQRGTSGTWAYSWNFILGHLPLLIHPGEPRSVLHICFGVGNSLSAVAAHHSVERVDSVELSPHVLEASRYFWTNDGVIDDPRVHTIIDDGRNYVMAARRRYDLILLEPPEIFTAGVINLYTREFYRDAAARLAPGGMMMQWLPLAEASVDEERMLFRAFSDVFPNATLWRQLETGPLLFVGTAEPLRIDYQRLAARMREDRVRQDLELIKVRGVDHLLSFFLLDAPAFRAYASEAPAVTDDRTVLDFSMPRFVGSGFGLGSFHDRVRGGVFAAIAERQRHFDARRSPVAPHLTNLGDDTPAAIEERIRAFRTAPAPERPPIAERSWRRWRREPVATELPSPAGFAGRGRAPRAAPAWTGARAGGRRPARRRAARPPP